MLLQQFLEENRIMYAQKEPMSRHTSFRIGGRADYFILPSDEIQLCRILDFLVCAGIDYFICGNLSNIVFSDEGYRGAVVCTSKIDSVKTEAHTLLCGGGVSLTKAAKSALSASLAGLEFAYGIPGTIGGGVYMNAGAYGGQMEDVVSFVNFYDLNKRRICTLKKEECRFGYRSSAFSSLPGVITSVGLHLSPSDPARIRETMNQNMETRKRKQPLEFPSAGSVFKRPEGHYAGQLIESLSLKGVSVGGAAVSQKHAGFIVNTGGATCSDVKALVSLIAQRVYDAYGIVLECEIEFVG